MSEGATAKAERYLDAVKATWATGQATEHTYRPHLREFLQSLKSGVVALNDPKAVACGAPDFNASRQTAHGLLTIGYVETKNLGVSLDKAERSDQLRRYRASLANLILTDYLEFRWYANGEALSSARIADKTGDHLNPRPRGAQEVQSLLANFLEHAPEPVRSAEELATRMARLAHLIRDLIVTELRSGRATATLTDFYKAFREVLIPDLTVEDFGDLFAQTLAYGLFAARVNHSSSVPFRRQDAAVEIPRSNPFLRQLFSSISGSDLEDEPFRVFVDDLAQLLADSDLKAVLRDFGRATGREDPVVHFYETFLSQYDPELRELRGVYFTPEPVVSYIVRSVDKILKSEFDCKEGLADSTKIEYERAADDGNVATHTAHRVLILDPALGTGTFLYEIIDLVRGVLQRQGNAGKWPGYVKEDLLPRLFGFELLIPAYAVAHLKLGMQLAGLDLPPSQQDTWRYEFKGDDRLRVYLTNSLEEAITRSDLTFGHYISEEANIAAEIKRDLPIMVVVGNPPYSGHSANASWRTVLVDRPGRAKGARKKTMRQQTFIGKLLSDYQQVDGAPLNEVQQKWLHDDYVKFIRFAQWRIEETGAGVLAFVTNHGYLDNPTFRGMRRLLMKTFSQIYVIDLHGNKKKRQKAPGGQRDDNVFDIQQGVAVSIFVKRPGETDDASVHHSDLWGRREDKYAWLASNDLSSTDWSRHDPRPPFYLFKPQDQDLFDEYRGAWSLKDAMPANAVGFVSGHDFLVVDIDRDRLEERIGAFLDSSATDDEIRERFFGHLKPTKKYPKGDSRDWQLAPRRRAMQADASWREKIVLSSYRPFDIRWVFYHPDALSQPQTKILQHLVSLPDNQALVTTRSVEIARGFEHAFCVTGVVQHHVVSSKEVNYVFPLYLATAPGEAYSRGVASEALIARARERARAGIIPMHDFPGEVARLRDLLLRLFPDASYERWPNFDPDFLAEVERKTELRFVPSDGDRRSTFDPDSLFNYIYAVLHCPSYRARYEEFFKTDYPRIPLTSDSDLFVHLSDQGSKLVALHTGSATPSPRTSFPVPGDNTVGPGFPKFVPTGEAIEETGATIQGRVYLNARQYFEGITADVWGFHVGGYQVCKKWLEDRRGRRLSNDELGDWERIVSAVRETIALMEQIDVAIPGWPIQ